MKYPQETPPQFLQNFVENFLEQGIKQRRGRDE